MFTKGDIRRLTLIVMKKYHDALLLELGRQEIVHFDEARIDGIGEKQRDQDIKEEKRIKYIYALIKALRAKLAVEDRPLPAGDRTGAAQVAVQRDTVSDELYLYALQRKLEAADAVARRLASEIKAARHKAEEIAKVRELGLDRTQVGGLELAAVAFGTLEKEIDEGLLGVERDFVIKQYFPYVLGVALSQNKPAMLTFLKRFGFEDKTYDLPAFSKPEEALADLQARLDTLGKRKARVDGYLAYRRSEWAETLRELDAIYKVLAKTMGVRRLFLFSEEVLVIHGWIEHKNLKRLTPVLEQICGGGYFLTVSTRSETGTYARKVPVLLKNNPFFKPFERIVKILGIPGSQEIDPTPIAALTYVIMFGVMFGDVGQGAVIVAVGLLMHLLAPRSPQRERLLADGGLILAYCGGSAALFGLVYGSVFSNEHLIPALWFHPMQHIMRLFFSTIMMGVFFIAMGLVLNILNLLQVRRYPEALFGARGLAGLLLYGGAVFLLVRYTQFDQAPGPIAFTALVLVPLAVFAVRNVLAKMFFKRDRMFPHGVFEYIVETLVEIMEMFSGFLSNTISFIRAGAFALSHAGLSIAVYTLAEIVSPGHWTVFSVSIVAVGNLFIILLEGLLCGIQTMRLEFYEFFGKFFKGGGVEFRPFSLRK